MNHKILETLEALAAACPWDSVDLWITRRPAGECNFTAYIHENEKLGFGGVWGHGDTAEKAASDALARMGTRDPEVARKVKIAELKAKIEQLQAVIIGLPPYRPNSELAEHAPSLQAKAVTIDVETATSGAV